LRPCGKRKTTGVLLKEWNVKMAFIKLNVKSDKLIVGFFV